MGVGIRLGDAEVDKLFLQRAQQTLRVKQEDMQLQYGVMIVIN